MEKKPDRKDELQAKRQRLLELRRQREKRAEELRASRQSVAEFSDLASPTPNRDRKDIDSLISTLLGESRPSSTGPGSPSRRTSRPTSVASGGHLTSDNAEPSQPPTPAPLSIPQTLSIVPVTTLWDTPASPTTEYVTYSKGVQTSEAWSSPITRSVGGSEDEDDWATRTPRTNKRMSRREREREEDIRQQLRKEIEDELKVALHPSTNAAAEAEQASAQKFPARALTDEELNAVTSSDDFLGFVERSTKVIERALQDEYDLLVDYAHGALEPDDEDERYGTRGKGRRVKEVAQYWDERWSKKRMISDLGYSPKFPELLLASYTKNPSAPHDPDGLVLVWNAHMPTTPEYIFHAASDILCARFSPFHPNLILGGAYSGQVLLWDTRARSAPVQKTSLTGNGHTHPIYSIDIVGTQNANNIISCSTDGVVCGWSVDMLAQPQEYIELATPHAKIDDMAPTCIAFPQSDPTYFLAGTEEGTIYPCHRYDRAGAKAGVDARLAYKGHAAPVMSLDFHPARGPVDLGDLVISSSVDWSVKLWRVRPPAATTSTNPTSGPAVATPLFEFFRDDLVYDARWSPVHPGIFALVDGAGTLEIFDINLDVEVPVAKITPSDRVGIGFAKRSLNRVAWEEREGKHIAVGGLDGVATVFEVGNELGGLEGVRTDEWTNLKKQIARWDVLSGSRVNGRT